MINFNEAYYCKADAKGRVMIPSALKNRLLPVLKEGFVLKRSVSGACLELWPMSQWDEMMLKIKKLNRFVKKNNVFKKAKDEGWVDEELPELLDIDKIIEHIKKI